MADKGIIVQRIKEKLKTYCSLNADIKVLVTGELI